VEQRGVGGHAWHSSRALLSSADLFRSVQDPLTAAQVSSSPLVRVAMEQDDERVKGCWEINYQAVNHSCRSSVLLYIACTVSLTSPTDTGDIALCMRRAWEGKRHFE
jgi:hypothetical protein